MVMFDRTVTICFKLINTVGCLCKIRSGKSYFLCVALLEVKPARCIVIYKCKICDGIMLILLRKAGFVYSLKQS